VQTTTIVLPKVTESQCKNGYDRRSKESFNSIPYNNELAIGLDNLKKVLFLFVTTQDKQFQNKFIVE
jgi:hypothetical protein